MGASAWLLLQIAAALGARPCVDGDWLFGFSECLADGTGGRSRGLFAYPPDESVCDSFSPSSRPTPEPLLDLPCHHVCEPGTHSAVELQRSAEGPPTLALTCRSCGPGSFSLGGGLLLDGAGGGFAGTWPKELSSLCFYRGTDYQWYTGANPPLLCLVHLRTPNQEMLAETRPGIWNAALPDGELDLPMVLAPGYHEACNPPNVSQVPGLVGAAVLVKRGTCPFQQKAEMMAAAGARAVVLYNNIPHAAFFYPAAANRTRLPSIPIFMITREQGERWIPHLQGSRLHVPSLRCSAAAREAMPMNSSFGTRLNNSNQSLWSESWGSPGATHFCASWTADPSGRFLHSGNNLHFHWIYSMLTLTLRFVRDGHLRFRYSVDAEAKYDGLSFQMDQSEVMGLVSQSNPARDMKVKVPRGTHSFTWVYRKDYGRTVGEDKARLQLLEAVGTENADAECHPCHASDVSRKGCDGCKRDTYLALPSNTCLSCPAGRWSMPGGVGMEACRSQRPCSQHDMERKYSAFEVVGGTQQAIDGEQCRRNESLLSYRWRLPRMCDPSNAASVPLPAATVGPCPACPMYQARKHGAACEPLSGTCARGQYPLRELKVTNWQAWPQSFSRELWGPPGSEAGSLPGGWHLAPDGSSALVGLAHEPQEEILDLHRVEVALLHLDVVTSHAGMLAFTIETSPPNAWGRMARLSVNSTPASGDVTSSDADPIQVVSLPLPAGLHRITWLWHYNVAMEAMDAGSGEGASGLRLIDVSVTHVPKAGVGRCELCPVGSSVDPGSSSCAPCPAGQSTLTYGADGQSSQGSSCVPCPAGRASQAGQSVCVKCGEGLESAPGAARCVPRPTLQLQSRQWNVTALLHAWHGAGSGSLVDGGLRKFQVESRSYYLSLLAPAIEPGSAGGARAYWWEQLAPLSSVAGGGPKAGVCQEERPALRLVADDLESLQATALGEEVGLWASFGGLCGPPGAQQLLRPAIFFRCDLSAELPSSPMSMWASPDVSFVEGRRPTSPRGCEDVALQWRSSFACPMCRAEDYEAVVASSCKSAGGRRVVYVKKRQCHGGVVQPPSYSEPCGQAMAVTAAITVPLALILFCLATYVLVLRRRYAKYKQLEEGRSGAAAVPTRIGAGSP